MSVKNMERLKLLDRILNLYKNLGVTTIQGTEVPLVMTVTIRGEEVGLKNIWIKRAKGLHYIRVDGIVYQFDAKVKRFFWDGMIFGPDVEEGILLMPIDLEGWLGLRLFLRGQVPISCLSISAPPCTGKSFAVSGLGGTLDGDVEVEKFLGRRWETDGEYRATVKSLIFSGKGLMLHAANGIAGSFDVVLEPKDFVRNLEEREAGHMEKVWYFSRVVASSVMVGSSQFLDLVEDMVYFVGGDYETDFEFGNRFKARTLGKNNHWTESVFLIESAFNEFLKESEPVGITVPQDCGSLKPDYPYFLKQDSRYWSKGVQSSPLSSAVSKMNIDRVQWLKECKVRGPCLTWHDGEVWCLADMWIEGSIVKLKSRCVRRDVSLMTEVFLKGIGVPMFSDIVALCDGVKRNVEYYEAAGRLLAGQSLFPVGHGRVDPYLNNLVAKNSLPGGSEKPVFERTMVVVFQSYFVLIPFDGRVGSFSVLGETVRFMKPTMLCFKGTGMKVREVGTGLYSDGDCEIFPDPGSVLSLALGCAIWLRPLKKRSMPDITFCLSDELWHEDSMKIWDDLADAGVWHPAVRLSVECLFNKNRVCHRNPYTVGSVVVGERFGTKIPWYCPDLTLNKPKDAEYAKVVTTYFLTTREVKVDDLLGDFRKWLGSKDGLKAISECKQINRTFEMSEENTLKMDLVDAKKQITDLVNKSGSDSELAANIATLKTEVAKLRTEKLELEEKLKIASLQLKSAEMENRNQREAMKLKNKELLDNASENKRRVGDAHKDKVECLEKQAVDHETKIVKLKSKHAIEVASLRETIDGMRARNGKREELDDSVRDARFDVFVARIKELEYQCECATASHDAIKDEVRWLRFENQKQTDALEEARKREHLLMAANNIFDAHKDRTAVSIKTQSSLVVIPVKDVKAEEAAVIPDYVPWKDELKKKLRDLAKFNEVPKKLADVVSYGVKEFETNKVVKDMKIERAMVSKFLHSAMRMNLIAKVKESPATWKLFEGESG